mmetsp:Transcript_7832/g.6928  ORF Transcript_7832/g.6928 Transcript_7832/m.6928 type:complete len:364 (+) Transcript_7832:304-1395(+)
MENNGLFFYLEHRFYGDSQPFPTLATENLRYLTSRHALADLAVFLTYANDKIVQEHGGEKRKIIVVGGSYPGALSAWFREKYPHIADGAWASSAVVNAIADFDMYDYQTFNSTSRSSLYCSETLQNFTIVYDRNIDQGNRAKIDEIKSFFGAEHFPDADFGLMIGSVFAGKIQYGGRTEVCDFIDTLEGLSIEEQYQALAKKYFGAEVINKHDRELKKLTNALKEDVGGRSWDYQFCTEFGYFQIAHKGINMRSKLVTREFWDDYCQDIFGKDIETHNAETNIYYGSVDGVSSNTFLVNGGEDGWQWAGVLESTGAKNQIVRKVQCENCAHCVELYNETDDDSEELKQVRIEVKEWVKTVLDE